MVIQHILLVIQRVVEVWNKAISDSIDDSHQLLCDFLPNIAEHSEETLKSKETVTSCLMLSALSLDLELVSQFA